MDYQQNVMYDFLKEHGQKFSERQIARIMAHKYTNWDNVFTTDLNPDESKYARPDAMLMHNLYPKRKKKGGRNTPGTALSG